MNTTRQLICLAIAALGTVSAQAQTNLLSDGDFQNFSSQVASGTFTTIAAGSNLGAWAVTGSSVDLIRNAYGSISDVSVDLAGTPGPGTLTQSFNAVAGTTYTLAWDYFKNASGEALNVGFGGSSTTYAVVSDITHATLNWTATSSGLQTVSFGTAVSGNLGPTLDNVTLTAAAVPEPASGALLLAGIGCMAWVVRRRSS